MAVIRVTRLGLGSLWPPTDTQVRGDVPSTMSDTVVTIPAGGVGIVRDLMVNAVVSGVAILDIWLNAPGGPFPIAGHQFDASAMWHWEGQLALLAGDSLLFDAYGAFSSMTYVITGALL